jgi:hypothetical protein
MTPDDLVEIREIENLKYRYLRHLDLKEFDELEQLFLPDARASYGGGAHELEGREAIGRFLRDSMGTPVLLTSHKCHHPEITLNADRSEATGVWALDDVVIHQEHQVTMRGAAYYEDTYRKVDGSWRIAATGYKRVYEELYPRASLRGLKVTADYWRTGGRSKLGPV